jgi:hypothetical protein
MTAIPKIQIMCDKCGRPTKANGSNAAGFRVWLRNYGWESRGEYDYCPECVPLLWKAEESRK